MSVWQDAPAFDADLGREATGAGILVDQELRGIALSDHGQRMDERVSGGASDEAQLCCGWATLPGVVIVRSLVGVNEMRHTLVL
jgi:hypothetical protein